MSEGVPELSAEVFSGCYQILAREQYKRKVIGRWREGNEVCGDLLSGRSWMRVMHDVGTV
jgi:hypothetical protein